MSYSVCCMLHVACCMFLPSVRRAACPSTGRPHLPLHVRAPAARVDPHAVDLLGDLAQPALALARRRRRRALALEGLAEEPPLLLGRRVLRRHDRGPSRSPCAPAWRQWARASVSCLAATRSSRQALASPSSGA